MRLCYIYRFCVCVVVAVVIVSVDHRKTERKKINLHILIPMLYLSAVAVAAKISNTEQEHSKKAIPFVYLVNSLYGQDWASDASEEEDDTKMSQKLRMPWFVRNFSFSFSLDADRLRILFRWSIVARGFGF